MIVVFNKYTDNTRKIQETMQCMNLNIKFVVLRDDGFLPAGVLSPYTYFVYEQNQEILEEKELYYNFLEVPEFWEIRSVGMRGAIYDMGCKKADIYFAESSEKKVYSVLNGVWKMAGCIRLITIISTP